MRYFHKQACDDGSTQCVMHVFATPYSPEQILQPILNMAPLYESDGMVHCRGTWSEQTWGEIGQEESCQQEVVPFHNCARSLTSTLSGSVSSDDRTLSDVATRPSGTLLGIVSGGRAMNKMGKQRGRQRGRLIGIYFFLSFFFFFWKAEAFSFSRT